MSLYIKNSLNFIDYIIENVNYFSDDEDIELLQNYCNIRDISNQRMKENKEWIEKKRSILINSKKNETPSMAEKKRVNILITGKEKNIKDQNKIEEYFNFHIFITFK